MIKHINKKKIDSDRQVGKIILKKYKKLVLVNSDNTLDLADNLGKKLIEHTYTVGDVEINIFQPYVLIKDYVGITYSNNFGNLGKCRVFVPSLYYCKQMQLDTEAKETLKRIIIHEYLHGVLCSSGLRATLQLGDVAEHALIYVLDKALVDLFDTGIKGL